MWYCICCQGLRCGVGIRNWNTLIEVAWSRSPWWLWLRTRRFSNFLPGRRTIRGIHWRTAETAEPQTRKNYERQPNAVWLRWRTADRMSVGALGFHNGVRCNCTSTRRDGWAGVSRLSAVMSIDPCLRLKPSSRVAGQSQKWLAFYDRSADKMWLTSVNDGTDMSTVYSLEQLNSLEGFRYRDPIILIVNQFLRVRKPRGRGSGWDVANRA